MTQKYDFQGIGKAEAMLVFTALAASPFASLTQGFVGKLLFWILTQVGSFLASWGLVILNIGVANVQVLIEKNAYDGAFEDAFKVINETGGRLTDAQKAEIDGKVIAAFRHFAAFGSV